MDVLLGGAIAIVAGVVSWFLNSLTTRQAQQRQQQHDLQMQEQRLHADRQGKQDEAIRAMRRARLQPVFDILTELRDWLPHWQWQKILSSFKESGRVEEAARKVLPEGTPTERIREFARRWEWPTKLPEPEPETVIRAWSIFLTVGDPELERNLLALLMSLPRWEGDEEKWEEMADLFAPAFAQLEAYAARIDEPQEAPP